MFYKIRYLRSGGRFRGVWLAAHFVPLDTNEDLMDICADLAQLLNPTRRALVQQQVPSLRLASLLTAGTVRRYAQLCDDLLRDTTKLLYDMQRGSHSGWEPDGRENESTNTDTPVNWSEGELRIKVDTEDLQRINFNATEMSSNEDENNEIERDEVGYRQSENMNEVKSESDDENEYETLLDDEDTNVTGSTSNNDIANLHNLSSLLEQIEDSGTPEMSNNTMHRTDTSTSLAIVTAEEITSCQDKTSGPCAQGLDNASGFVDVASRTTFYLTSSATAQMEEARSPIVYTSTDRRFQFANFATSTKSNEMSPIISTGITATIPITTTAPVVSTTTTYDARDRTPVFGSPRQMSPIISTSQSRRRLRFSPTRPDDSQCSAVKKMRMSNERYSEIGTPNQLLMNLRCSVTVPTGSQEVRLTQDGEEPINFSKEFSKKGGGMQIDSDVPGANSLGFMTPSTPSQAPTESSRRTPQATLPPGVRGVVTVPATRKRKVRGSAKVYKARKVKMTRFSPPLTRSRLRASRGSLRENISASCSPARSRSRSLPHQGRSISRIQSQENQSCTDAIEYQEIRKSTNIEPNLNNWDTSLTRTLQRQDTLHRDTATPPPNQLDIASPINSTREFENEEIRIQESFERMVLCFGAGSDMTTTPEDSLSSSQFEHRVIVTSADIHEEPNRQQLLSPASAFRSFRTSDASLAIREITATSPHLSYVETSSIISSNHRYIEMCAGIRQEPKEWPILTPPPAFRSDFQTPSPHMVLADNVESPYSTTTDEEPSCEEISPMETEKNYATEIDRKPENRDSKNLVTIEEVSVPINSENNNEITSHVSEESLETTGSVSESSESEKDYEESFSSEENNKNQEKYRSLLIEEIEDNSVRILNNILRIPETIEEVSEPNESHNEEEIIETDHEEISNAQYENNDEEDFDMEESNYVDDDNEMIVENEMVEPVQVNLDTQNNLEENAMESQDAPYSDDSTSSQSSLGLDSISFIYQRNTEFDPSRALVMVKNKVSENYELNETIRNEWRNKFL